jgi:hypothetical protein
VLSLAACAPAPDGQPCTLATVGALRLTQDDVRALRAHMQPPPTEQEAARLLIDAILAQHILQGELTHKAPRDRLADYQQWQALLLTEEPDHDRRAKLAIERLSATKKSLDVRIGDCPLSAKL